MTGARPAEKLRNRRSKGLRLDASIRAILAAGLDAEPAIENQRHRAGLDASVEFVESAAHRLAGQVLSDLDVEAVALEFVGDLAGVVDGLLERSIGVGIFGVADDKRKPVAAIVRSNRRDKRHDR